MNEIFNTRRFGKYLLSDIRNCMAGFGLNTVVISLMGLVIYAGTIIMGFIFNGTWEGPGIGFRIATFCIAMFIFAVSMPVKCYGGITEKRKGTAWLTLPASAAEKFLSIILCTIFIVPIVTGGVYLAIDAILCAFDPTCGTSIFSACRETIGTLLNLAIASEEDVMNIPALGDLIHQINNPFLYIDDIIMVGLTFLAGAIWFKKSKTAKTILSVIAYSTVAGIVTSPIITHFTMDIINNMNLVETTADLNNLLSTWPFRHIALLDTINDTLTNLALAGLIYLRIKTLKH